MQFKYQIEIDAYLARFQSKMPELFKPGNRRSYRYVSSTNTSMNHLPIFVLNPNRINGKDGKGGGVEGYALSCFDTDCHACSVYAELKKNCKNIKKSIGDSLAVGTLSNTDGMVTNKNTRGHYNLFETPECDLSVKFNIIKSLP